MYKYCLILFLGFSLSANAQETAKWNLQQCINRALEKNIQIKQGEVQYEIATNNLTAAQLSRIPSLNASGNHNYNIGRTIDPFTNTFNNQTIQSNSFSLSAGVILYGGNQVNNAIKQNEVVQKASEQAIEVTKNQISLSVANTYLLILQGEENLKIALSQKELTQKQLEQAQKMVANGASNKGLALNLEAQMASDQVQIVNAKNSIQLAYNTMINLLQIGPDEDFEVALYEVDNLPTMPLESVNQLYEIANQNLPEIKQAKLTVDQNEYGEKLAYSSMLPSLSAYGNVNSVYSESGLEASFAGFQVVPIGITESSNEVVVTTLEQFEYQTKPFNEQLSDNLGQSVGLSLSIPIFNGWRNKSSYENAKLNTQISELNLTATQNQLKADITTAYTNLLGAKSRLDAALSSELAQRKNFEFSQSRFDAGMMNSVDLLNAKNTWSQSLINLTNSKYEYLFRSLIIEFYKGNPLTL